MIVRIVLFLASVLLTVSATTVSFAAKWYVDASASGSGHGRDWQNAFTTIQRGIDAASNGDMVTVAEGTYVENIQFRGRNIILRSTNPQDPVTVASTIIDGNRAGPVVTFDGTENASCFLSGFTIWNGEYLEGAGVSGENAVATIQYNLIALNEGCGLYQCNGLVMQNIITQNADSGLMSCSGRILNNLISKNSGVQGGGLRICQGDISDNTIRHNSAESEGGGMFRCGGGVIRNNVISGNSAGTYGGGIYDCASPLVNNTIVGNSAGIRGGGPFEEVETSGVIRNCIIWGNEAPRSPQIYALFSEIAHSCIQDWTRGGAGNIALDPEFVDPNGPDGNPSTTWDNDYRLSPGSPCIDSGSNEALEHPRLDRDGKLRIAPGRDSLAVDMGAFEYNSKHFAITEITRLDGDSVFLTWNSQPNNSYTLWFLEDPSTGAWVKGETLPSWGATTSRSVLLGYAVRGFCVVEMTD